MVAWFVVALIAVAIQIVSYLIMPKPKPPKPQAAKDMDDPTAEAGREIPVVFGALTVKGLNVIWFGEKSKHTYQVKA